jgi:hypothetical protein
MVILLLMIIGVAANFAVEKMFTVLGGDRLCRKICGIKK